MNILRKCVKIYGKWREKRLRARLGYYAATAFVHPDNYIVGANLLSIADNSIIQPGGTIILTGWGGVKIGRWTDVSYNVTIINSNHVPLVGVPQHLASCKHLNDRDTLIEIGDDCWVAANVTLLPGSKLNRGCVVGAGALVNKEIPPYAVVAGVPAKVVAVKFSLEQIIAHEKSIYTVEERFTESYLKDLFSSHYVGKKVIGSHRPNNEQERNLKTDI